MINKNPNKKIIAPSIWFGPSGPQNYKDIYQIALNHPYHSTVFLCPPWEKIYHTDSERKESFEEACKIHQEILKIYQSLQYKVIELPLVSSEKRIEIILSHIA